MPATAQPKANMTTPLAASTALTSLFDQHPVRSPPGPLHSPRDHLARFHVTVRREGNLRIGGTEEWGHCNGPPWIDQAEMRISPAYAAAFAEATPADRRLGGGRGEGGPATGLRSRGYEGEVDSTGSAEEIRGTRAVKPRGSTSLGRTGSISELPGCEESWYHASDGRAAWTHSTSSWRANGSRRKC
jgi:hypothetical protein